MPIIMLYKSPTGSSYPASVTKKTFRLHRASAPSLLPGFLRSPTPLPVAYAERVKHIVALNPSPPAICPIRFAAFIEPASLTQHLSVRVIGRPSPRINEIVLAGAPPSPDTDLRLARTSASPRTSGSTPRPTTTCCKGAGRSPRCRPGPSHIG